MNSWEKQVMGETRPDGSFVPYQTEKGRPIRIKEYSQKRHSFEENRKRRLAQGG